VNCPHCGTTLVCRACGIAVDEAAARAGDDLLLPLSPDEADAEAQRLSQTFLVVAKGHGDLLEQLQEVVGDLGWVKLIKDRRDDPTILPREGRQGTVHVDQDLNP
jgi:hypothetical protein